MKHVKILFFLVFCAAIALVAVQNAEVLAKVQPMLVNWPGMLFVEFGLPMYVLIAILFGAGFVVTTLPYLGEHRRLQRAVAEARHQVAGLERELRPEPESASCPLAERESAPPQAGIRVESDITHTPSESEQGDNFSVPSPRGTISANISSTETSTLTLQTPMESTMKKTSASEAEDKVLADNTTVPSSEGGEGPSDSARLSQTADGTDAPQSGLDAGAEPQGQTPAEPSPTTTEPLESSPEPASDVAGPSKTVLESISESLERQAAQASLKTTGTQAAPANQESNPISGSSLPDQSAANGSTFREDEVLARPAGPGWGAVLLLSAALALVVSSGVFIVLNSQITAMSAQLSDLHIQSGHTASTQEEMGRILEQERVAVRDELQSLEQGQKHLAAGVDALEEHVAALQTLPELFRKQLVAGFLRDAAGRTALWGTQVDTDEQRSTLEQIEEMFQSLARELDAPGVVR